jgi:hypothetical protein
MGRGKYIKLLNKKPVYTYFDPNILKTSEAMHTYAFAKGFY